MLRLSSTIGLGVKGIVYGLPLQGHPGLSQRCSYPQGGCVNGGKQGGHGNGGKQGRGPETQLVGHPYGPGVGGGGVWRR